MKLLVIPIFVPHAGCPHNCTFCNQKVISGAKKQPGAEDIIDEINIYKNAADRFDEVQLSFYGGSFTAISENLQIEYLEAVQPFLKSNGGFIDTLRCSTRPDAISANVIERLKKYHLTIVELGTQSMSNDVLSACERGHSVEDTTKAARMLKQNGFTLGLQMMTGLPGSSFETDMETANLIIKEKPDFVRIYPTVVVKNTQMEKDYLSKKYIPETLDEAVRLCAELAEKFESHGIKVARIGLQSTDTISNGKDSEIVAGPYHEAFGQLVKSARYYKLLENKILQEHFSDFKELVIFTKKSEISTIIGQKRQNIIKLKDRFGFLRVNVKPGGPEDALAYPNAVYIVI